MTENQYTNYSIFIMAHDVNIVDDIVNELSPLKVNIFNGFQYPSFAKLVNDIIVAAENDNVIIINYKARPRKEHIYKTLDLLRKGYGFVGLYRYGFFGINKNLVNKIGFFDERYLGGEYEDCDYCRRILEHNIAEYVSEEIPYIFKPSTWNNTIAKSFFYKKWSVRANNIIYKNIDDEKYDYDLKIKEKNDVFLDASHSVNLVDPDMSWYKVKIIHNF